MQQPWIGLEVAGCIVDRLVSEGPYSWVYAATHVSGQYRRAIKVAKRAPDIGRLDSNAVTVAHSPVLARTRCRLRHTGGSGEVIPAGGLLLKAQYQKLTSVNDPALVTVHEGRLRNRTFYYAMDMLDGPNLREQMTTGRVQVSWLIAVSDGMARLAANPKFRYHGDLKPDNIVISTSGVKIIDPGHFEGMEIFPLDTLHWPSAEGDYQDVAVTTPLYYPSLVPDDMFAFGLMLWELACGRHPLADQIPAGGLAGVFDMYKFAAVRPPRWTNPEIPAALEVVALKCLGLQAVDDGMEWCREYEHFGEVTKALHALAESGVGEI